MPKENERDVQMTPDYVQNKIKVRFVSSIDEVLAAALLDGTGNAASTLSLFRMAKATLLARPNRSLPLRN